MLFLQTSRVPQPPTFMQLSKSILNVSAFAALPMASTQEAAKELIDSRGRMNYTSPEHSSTTTFFYDEAFFFPAFTATQKRNTRPCDLNEARSHASNGEIPSQNTFIDSDVNTAYHMANQDLGQDQSLSLSNVRQCPTPSQYFTGRKEALSRLGKIFSAPVVTLFGPDQHMLASFVRHTFSTRAVFLLASSAEALAVGLAQTSLQDPQVLTATLLVLENTHPSLVLADHLPACCSSPVLITSTNHAVSHLASSPAYGFQLPDHPNQQIMNKLRGSVQKALEPKQHIVTLVASGGTGKTQTVLKFISDNSSRFSNIWFFDATSDTTLTADFKALGKVASVGEDVKDVRDFLARMDHNWLCIFDNADDKELYLKDYIPSCSHGNIIITSRLLEASQMDSPGCHLEFGDLNKDDAIELLLKYAHKESSETNKSLAAEIADTLGCNALALSTSGAYILTTRTCTLSNYLGHFNKKRKEILNYRLRSLDSYQRTIFSAFKMNFENLSLPTQYLMQICAYIHPTAIPMEMFIRAASFEGNDIGSADLHRPTQAISLTEKFLSLFGEADSWDDSVNELCQLSLASYDDLQNTLTFHSVIHKCVRETVPSEVDMAQAAMIGGHTCEPYAIRKSTHCPCTDLLARIFWDSGFWAQTEALEEQTVMISKEGLGQRHPDTLMAMIKLGATYRTRGKLEAAEYTDQEAVSLCKDVHGENHPDTVLSMANLAATYQARGKLEEAERLKEEVLSIRKVILGERHPATLTSMSNLAFTYKHRGNLEAAEKLEEQVLALRKDILGEHHPNTLTSIANLAFTYRQLGRLEAAERLAEEVLSLRKHLLGKHHPDTLSSMDHLALTYQARGKLEIAEKMEEEVLPLRKEFLGEHHPDTLRSMHNLAAIYHELNKLEEAEILAEQVLLLRKDALGEHHPDTLSSMAKLAAVYQARGKSEASDGT
ncbi:hypothetical protein BDP27DRAFT_1427696 [Rhodocollybia butyracea]|uniref:TPR-like protein n=1 Tax=Rhodocollybia butyracea TaxID=206335 RepID=A0A9P5U0I9_9AGAR|nr:hypothetical protein BDP27DRAFT_1427696 [Rhodocollybia butyracea]